MKQKTVIIFVVGMVVGAWIAQESGKVTKEKTKVEVTQDHTQIQDNKTVIEKIKPDGTVIRKIVQNTNTKVDVKKDTEQKSVEIVDRTKNWYIGAMAGNNFSTATPVFGAEIHKRIMGPFSAGLFLLTDKTAGVTIGMSL